MSDLQFLSILIINAVRKEAVHSPEISEIFSTTTPELTRKNENRRKVSKKGNVSYYPDLGIQAELLSFNWKACNLCCFSRSCVTTDNHHLVAVD
jgi:hypothetical protein